MSKITENKPTGDMGRELSIGNVKLKNRFVLAPLKTSLNEVGGVTTESARNFYARIAKGGTALIILEPAAVSVDGLEHPKQLRLYDDSHVAQVAFLVREAHDNGAKVAVHINHPGRAANPKAIDGRPLAPSEMVCPTTGAAAAEMTRKQIERVLDDFGAAAAKAVETGADLIELQMGHGYLVSQFMSQRTNKRTDDWGDRELFPRRVLETVLAGAGDVPVMVRISGNEFVEGGLNPGNLKWLFVLLEAKNVAALHVGFGNSCDNPAWYFGHMSLPQEPQFAALSAVRGATDLTVIAAGRLGDGEKIERVSRDNLADAVALGRPLVADPDFPRKWLAGEEDAILHCGACLQTCLSQVRSAAPIRCMANPWTVATAPQKPQAVKKVMVVGGGPAGITAAVAASRRGHDVSLYEKNPRAGGQFAFAARVESKSGMSKVLDGLIGRLSRSSVETHFGCVVDAKTVKSETPDFLVLATGARQRVPAIKGIETQHVVTAFEFLENDEPISGERVLVIGAGMVGLEVAEILLAMGNKVVACRRSEVIGADMDPISRNLMMKRLGGNPDVELMPCTELRAFTPKGVEALQNGREILMEPFDTVVICAGSEGNTELLADIESSPLEVRVIGDALEPRNIEKAVMEGLEVAEAI